MSSLDLHGGDEDTRSAREPGSGDPHSNKLDWIDEICTISSAQRCHGDWEESHWEGACDTETHSYISVAAVLCFPAVTPEEWPHIRNVCLYHSTITSLWKQSERMKGDCIFFFFLKSTFTLTSFNITVHSIVTIATRASWFEEEKIRSHYGDVGLRPFTSPTHLIVGFPSLRPATRCASPLLTLIVCIQSDINMMQIMNFNQD